jgi:hypothetical protein
LFLSVNEVRNAVGPIDNKDVVLGCYHKHDIAIKSTYLDGSISVVIVGLRQQREAPLFPRDGDLKSEFKARDVEIDASAIYAIGF